MGFALLCACIAPALVPLAHASPISKNKPGCGSTCSSTGHTTFIYDSTTKLNSTATATGSTVTVVSAPSATTVIEQIFEQPYHAPSTVAAPSSVATPSSVAAPSSVALPSSFSTVLTSGSASLPAISMPTLSFTPMPSVPSHPARPVPTSDPVATPSTGTGTSPQLPKPWRQPEDKEFTFDQPSRPYSYDPVTGLFDPPDFHRSGKQGEFGNDGGSETDGNGIGDLSNYGNRESHDEGTSEPNCDEDVETGVHNATATEGAPFNGFHRTTEGYPSLTGHRDMLPRDDAPSPVEPYKLPHVTTVMEHPEILSDPRFWKELGRPMPPQYDHSHDRNELGLPWHHEGDINVALAARSYQMPEPWSPPSNDFDVSELRTLEYDYEHPDTVQPTTEIVREDDLEDDPEGDPEDESEDDPEMEYEETDLGEELGFLDVILDSLFLSRRDEAPFPHPKVIETELHKGPTFQEERKKILTHHVRRGPPPTDRDIVLWFIQALQKPGPLDRKVVVPYMTTIINELQKDPSLIEELKKIPDPMEDDHPPLVRRDGSPDDRTLVLNFLKEMQTDQPHDPSVPAPDMMTIMAELQRDPSLNEELKKIQSHLHKHDGHSTVRRDGSLDDRAIVLNFLKEMQTDQPHDPSVPIPDPMTIIRELQRDPSLNEELQKIRHHLGKHVGPPSVRRDSSLDDRTLVLNFLKEMQTDHPMDPTGPVPDMMTIMTEVQKDPALQEEVKKLTQYLHKHDGPRALASRMPPRKGPHITNTGPITSPPPANAALAARDELPDAWHAPEPSMDVADFDSPEKTWGASASDPGYRWHGWERLASVGDTWHGEYVPGEWHPWDGPAHVDGVAPPSDMAWEDEEHKDDVTHTASETEQGDQRTGYRWDSTDDPFASMWWLACAGTKQCPPWNYDAEGVNFEDRTGHGPVGTNPQVDDFLGVLPWLEGDGASGLRRRADALAPRKEKDKINKAVANNLLAQWHYMFGPNGEAFDRWPHGPYGPGLERVKYEAPWVTYDLGGDTDDSQPFYGDGSMDHAGDA